VSDPRTNPPLPRWTLAELGEKVEEALSVDYEGQSNGQIRDVPNARTIRYYTTLGLIDRPAEMRGRTALYATRHLLQLVAIKRLQLEGLALSAIQERLAGATNEALARLARLPAHLDRPAGEGPAPSRPPVLSGLRPPAEAAASRRAGFWRGTAPELEVRLEVEAAEAPGEAPAEANGARVGSLVARPLTGLSLGAGITLLVEAERRLDAADLEALEAAVAPLLSTLRARGILASRLRGDAP
jgi:DNA-binding transcriptional MerR regulator